MSVDRLSHADQMSDADLMVRPTAAIDRARSRSVTIGAVGIVLGVIGFVLKGDAFWPSYLIAFYFWTGVTIGSMAVLMVHHLSGGGWGMVGRRIWEAATRTLPLMAVLFIPIWIERAKLYPWARPGAAADPEIHKKIVYLNPTFFTIRAVLYFVIWGTLIYFLNKWSKEQDETPTLLPGPQDARFRTLSGPGLVIYMLTITFMSVDWIMSLDPHWYSTIFGIITLGGQGLAALAFTLVIVAILIQVRPMSEVAGTEQIHDISKLMFAFVMLWAYFNVSQLIIIWSGNLPEEIPFYLERLQGTWEPISILVLLGQFVAPFLLLLSRSLKRNPQRVKWIAFWILIMRVVDIGWTIGPTPHFHRTASTLSWVDFAVVLAIGGAWLTVFWRNLGSRSVVPAKDPYFKEALAHGGH
jgi:hypothetical protein